MTRARGILPLGQVLRRLLAVMIYSPFRCCVIRAPSCFDLCAVSLIVFFRYCPRACLACTLQLVRRARMGAELVKS